LEAATHVKLCRQFNVSAIRVFLKLTCNVVVQCQRFRKKLIGCERFSIKSNYSENQHGGQSCLHGVYGEQQGQLRVPMDLTVDVGPCGVIFDLLLIKATLMVDRRATTMEIIVVLCSDLLLKSSLVTRMPETWRMSAVTTV